MTKEKVCALLAKACEGDTIAAVAREIGISPQYFGMILQGKRSPSAEVLAFLGLEKRVEYVRKSG